MIGLPVGNVLGAGLYRKLFLNASTKSDILGGVLGLILSGLAAMGGLFAMDILGGSIGLVFALFGSSLGGVLGYAIGSKIHCTP